MPKQITIDKRLTLSEKWEAMEKFDTSGQEILATLLNILPWLVSAYKPQRTNRKYEPFRHLGFIFSDLCPIE